jgi:hypothetical protein
LVRIVGGDAQALALATRSTGESDANLRDAAAFYIQQVMFAVGSDSYRVLGLDAGASDEQLKSHHRWLTRWLHPDRNRDDWEAVYSERVNRAWQDLRNSERRQRYDGSRSGSAASGSVYLDNKRFPGRAIQLEATDSGPSLRWLPHAVFGGLGLSAVAIVALYYALRFAEQPHALQVASTQTDSSLESSALINPRIAQGDLQASSAGAPQGISASGAIEPVAEHPEPAPSMTLASSEPFPSEPLRSEPPASSTEAPELPPVAPASVIPVIKQASVPAPEPVKPRVALPKLEQAALASIDRASQIEQRVLPSEPVPAPETMPEIRQAPRTAPVSQHEADRIMGRFSDVYAHGDLAGMRAMFTPDATSPDGGLDEILDEYDRLFGHSKQRRLAFQDVKWSASAKTFTIVASYDATLKTGIMMRTHSQGRIRMEMRQVNGQWRIYRLENNERAD